MFDDASIDDEDAGQDTDPEADEASSGEHAEDPDIDVAVVGVILVSTQGQESSTQLASIVEVSNLGVTPITAVQLRSFAFGGYWTRSSIFALPENGEDAMPIAPGETVTLRFGHIEGGALFDCAAWDGPRETEVVLQLAVDDAMIDAPALANVRCRELD